MTPREMKEKIVWLGHDAFRVEASQTVYIDPYEIETGPTADIILVTHDHFDHCSPDDVAKIQGPDTVVVTEKDSAGKLSGNVKTLAPGESLTVADAKITAVPAYNTNKNFHPKENGWLGFVLEIDGVSIYHAGDTDHIPEMADLDVHIALLPVSGTYVMTADEAVQAALAINPTLAIPMHYGAIVGGNSDAIDFKDKLAGKVEVAIL